MDDSEQFSVDTVLAPVDGSDESATAVEYAIAIADRYDASVHSLYVLGHGVVRGIDVGTVEETVVAENTKGFRRHQQRRRERRRPAVDVGRRRLLTESKTRHPATSSSIPPTRSMPISSSFHASR